MFGSFAMSFDTSCSVVFSRMSSSGALFDVSDGNVGGVDVSWALSTETLALALLIFS